MCACLRSSSSLKGCPACSGRIARSLCCAGTVSPRLVGEDASGFARLGARARRRRSRSLTSISQSKGGSRSGPAVLWLHPKTALLDKERDALNLYLDTGGRLLIAAQAGAEGLLACALGWSGLRLRSGVVVDPDVSGTADVQGDPAVMIAAYTDHPIVARLAASGLRTLLRRAAPIELRNSPVGTLSP